MQISDLIHSNTSLYSIEPPRILMRFEKYIDERACPTDLEINQCLDKTFKRVFFTLMKPYFDYR